MASPNGKKPNPDTQEAENVPDNGRMSNSQSEKEGNSTLCEGMPKPSAFSATAIEGYETLIQDALQDVHECSQKLFAAVESLEKQEEATLNEFLLKTIEQVQLSEHLRNNRHNALNAISALNGEFDH